MLKQLWKDPVWASVIATGIAAALGSMGAYSLGYWSAINGLLLKFWTFLLLQSAISNWVIILLAIPSVLIGLLLVAGLWSHWFGQSGKDAHWSNYRMDTFFGLRWRWHYDGVSIEGLTTFCPHCDYQVYPSNVSAYASIDRIDFKCDSCHSHLGSFNETEWDLKSKVARFIQQKLRAGSWESAQT